MPFQPTQNLIPLRVLFIDDSTNDVFLLSSVLTHAGFDLTQDHIATTSLLAEALAKPYEIIITDFHLRGSTAFDVLQIVHQFGCDVPVIVVSGLAGEELAVDVIKAGADDYVLKNNSQRLIASVQREIREAKRRRQQTAAEEALRENEELLRAVLESLPVGVWITGPDGVIKTGNAAAIGIWGGARYVGREGYREYKAWWLGTGGKVEPEEWAAIRAMKTGRPVLNDEMEIETFDGLRKIIVNSAAPIFSPQGQVKGAVIVNKDVTENRRALEELRRSKERFYKIFCSCPTGICISDSENGKIIDANESFLQSTGFTKEEVIDRTCSELDLWVDPEQETLLKIEALRQSGRVMGNLEARYKAKDGQSGHVLLSMEIVSLEGRSCLLTFFNDITSRKNLETQFLRAQKMESIGLLAGGVAHDFNNLLTVIQGYSAIIEASANLNADVSDGIAQIRESAERAANLTRQLLAFGRKQVLKSEVIDLNLVVQGVAKMLRRVVEEDVVVDLRCLPSLPAINADIGMVEQVLVNLAVNARDAMPKGGNLIISTARATIIERDKVNNLDARPGDYVCLSVTDTGSGMSPQTMARIFEPFYTTKENGKGTGLGLASVYGIMKQHGGWVNVSSREGYGTTFDTYFPVSDQAFIPKKVVAPSVNVSGTESILVAEDDEALRNLACRCLTRGGYKVFPVASGVRAVEWRQTHHERIDLLFTDIIMPEGMNGLELGAQMRVFDPTLKVIYSSGYSSDISGLDVSQLDRMHFIRKPYQPEDLLKMVRQCLDARLEGP